ncbi:MAG: hypothetical protein AD742_01000 [Methylibium sp. NZG]|nr:MAG: hypothetical protein AD742_01000 [Methylibium sp. NZG]
MTDATAFTKLVPGFDFLQSLVKNAGSALPTIGQWVAPTLNPEELEKRIEELRTVQFWLEQNARMLGATIQALEVQRMTLSTLKTMNVQMEDLRDSLRIKLPDGKRDGDRDGEKDGDRDGDSDGEGDADSDTEPADSRPQTAEPASKSRRAESPPPAVDPLQWWGALTQQFTELASTAMKDNAADAAKSLATSMVKQGFDAAGKTLKKAAAVPASVARKVTGAHAKPAKAPKPPQRTPSTGRAKPAPRTARTTPRT